MKFNKRKADIAVARSCLNHTEIAEKAKMQVATVSKVLACKDEVFPRTAGKVAKALGCDVAELLED